MKEFWRNILNIYYQPGTRERVPWQAAVRAEVRLQHADPLRHRHPGHGAPRHGHGGRLGPLRQG